MLKHGSAYVDLGQNYYEERYRDRTIKRLKRKAQSFGYLLVKEAETQPSTVVALIQLVTPKLLERHFSSL